MLGPERTAYVRDHLKLTYDPRGKIRKWAGMLDLNGTSMVALVDCRRPGKTMYVNEIHGENVLFYLSNDPRDDYNTLLKNEAALAPSKKRRIRFLVGENSKSFDMGDFVVTEQVGERVRLTRCGDSFPLPGDSNFKHVSEEKAHSLLVGLFGEKYVLYEPFSINSHGGTYCVDFVVQANRPGIAPIGIEVKSTMGAWKHNLKDNLRKVGLYKKCMNTDCFVLVMEPYAKAYKLAEGDLVEFETLIAFRDAVAT